MKILVVYYSRDGHTKTIAQAIATSLHAEIEEIKEVKERKGIIGWLMAGHDACRKKESEIIAPTKNPTDYDLVVIGTPIWGWTMVPAIRSWLNKVGPHFKEVAFFATMGGSGDQRAFNDMKQMCGKVPLLTVSFIDREIKKYAHKEKLETFINELQRIIK